MQFRDFCPNICARIIIRVFLEGKNSLRHTNSFVTALLQKQQQHHQQNKKRKRLTQMLHRECHVKHCFLSFQKFHHSCVRRHSTQKMIVMEEEFHTTISP